MRAFVCFFAFVAVAYAKPQYNYDAGPIAVPQVNFNQGHQQVGGPSYNSQQGSSPQYSTAPQQFGGPQLGGQQFGSHQGPQVSSPQFSTPTVGGPHYEEPVVQSHEAPLITKQFYLHSAPEDHDSIGKTKHLVIGRPQKNYRVVFIKAPSDTNANVHLSAEYAPQEEKTVIYVLSQKDTALDIDNIATPAPTQPSKPEVFFIKYKTPEEAAHAQQEIQNHYNVLGGQSQFSDEGHAPVTSVVGSLGQPTESQGSSGLGNGYLPPQ